MWFEFSKQPSCVIIILLEDFSILPVWIVTQNNGYYQIPREVDGKRNIFNALIWYRLSCPRRAQFTSRKIKFAAP